MRKRTLCLVSILLLFGAVLVCPPNVQADPVDLWVVIVGGAKGFRPYYDQFLWDGYYMYYTFSHLDSV